LVLKIRTINFIDLGKVVHVLKKDGGLHHIRKNPFLQLVNTASIFFMTLM